MDDLPWTAPAPQSGVSETTLRGQLNGVLGKLVDTSGSTNADLVTALTAVAAAINAKPSA